MSDKKMDLPDELGNLVDKAIKDANQGLEVGWMLIVVSHGQPIQTMGNTEESTQIIMCQIASNAIESEIMQKASLLNPKGEV